MIYLSALIGSFLFILIRLKIEKQKSDDKPRYRIKWKVYLSKQWDDFVFSISAGQALAYFQKPLFFGYTIWAEWDNEKAISLYEYSDEAIAGGLGLFGSMLIMMVFKCMIRKTMGRGKK